jgi:hypothetical protein
MLLSRFTAGEAILISPHHGTAPMLAFRRTVLPTLMGLGILFGCQKHTQSPINQVELLFSKPDPVGLYVIDIKDEVGSRIEDDVVVDIASHTCGLDRVFLRNSVVNLSHNGLPIPNGIDNRAPRPDGLCYWLVRRSDRELWYYIGTREQFASLDRTAVHDVNGRRFQF